MLPLSPRMAGWPTRVVTASCLAVLLPVPAGARQDAPREAAHHAAAHSTAQHGASGHGASGHGTATHDPHHAAGHPTAGHNAGAHGTAHGATAHGAPAHATPHGAPHGAHHPAVARPAAPVPAPAVPVPVPTPPPVPPPPQKGSNSGLPIPRFAALRADTVNLRSGPGTRYPIQWVYKRKDLPVQVEREFDVWRLVDFSDGTKGWVNQAVLVGTRTFLLLDAAGGTAAGGAPGTSDGVPDGAAAATPAGTAAGTGTMPAGTLAMRARPDDAADVVAMVKPGVVGRIRACAAGSGWCRVSIRDYTGWLPRRALWGLLPDETISPP
ncbi:MAG: hypothetical protein INR65_18590 [Gluconacetobacter diazotrophicus]|nr:hypothetical protein [Gluconacetobacter diazotrophicus]